MPVSEPFHLVPAQTLTAWAAPEPAVQAPQIDLPLGVSERPVVSTELLAQSFSLDAESLARYPDARSLTAVLAQHLGRGSREVLIGAGADELLDRAFRAMLDPGDNVLVTAPVFGRLAHYARLARASCTAVPWEGAAFPAAALLAQVQPRSRIIAVISPCNPTGQTLTADDLKALSAGAPNALIVLDMVYSEFAQEDLTPVAQCLGNVLVVRSLSKAWGLPGLRIGYGVGHPEVMAWLRLCGPAYSVARPSLALAHARLSVGGPDCQVYVERVQNERRRLERLLQHLGAQPWPPSQANFVLARFADAPWVSRALQSLGIGIFEVPDAPGLQDARRLTCPGDAEAFARLEAGLGAVLAPQSLLFDLHGTLCDAHSGELTCSAEALGRLAQSRPLAVVTSWDRQTAQQFLRRTDILPLFSAVVTCEDAPPKPDPAPVKLALDRLGVQTAWFVGDTPHDVRAARGASAQGYGIVPIGLCVDSGQAAQALTAQRSLLRRAGAAAVLDQVEELEERCPKSHSKRS